ncbi:hypothetical protein [Nostoc parmelioides]|uniref:hypothetical protein n=1 Tax=Nostoc parmelioides TaxID=1521621 RepID=UPI001683B31E|nr:hypothetical protein [Nostoc parmelioides]
MMLKPNSFNGRYRTYIPIIRNQRSVHSTGESSSYADPIAHLFALIVNYQPSAINAAYK